MNKSIKNHFLYFWWVYVLICISCILIWGYAFEARLSPSGNEQLRIAFIGTDFDDEKLSESLETELPALTNQEIKKISVSTISDTGFYFENTLYSLSQQCDFVIFTESTITDGIASFYFYRNFNNAQFFNYVEDADFYMVEDEVCGIKIDCETSGNFSKFYSGTDACYVFFGIKSQNLAGINGVGNQSDDCALQTLKWLME